MIKISESEKWTAVVECDKHYDGLFYYGVKTTKIFCRPSCRSKLPLKKNVVFFVNCDDALKENFRPCKRCRPDLLSYDPNNELIIKIKKIIEENYCNTINIETLAKDLGISRSQLSRVFKEIEQISIVDYLTKVRIDNSLELLKNGELKIIDVAYSVGFQSLSNYYRCFKKQIQLTPKEFKDANS
jgi:AraC family transcriptional regulator, regulatory protein of adaptative response / methylphosphotriester-DNA alkyltransferase methyltransferase